jgi:hypothetical protein
MCKFDHEGDAECKAKQRARGRSHQSSDTKSYHELSRSSTCCESKTWKVFATASQEIHQADLQEINSVCFWSPILFNRHWFEKHERLIKGDFLESFERRLFAIVSQYHYGSNGSSFQNQLRIFIANLTNFWDRCPFSPVNSRREISWNGRGQIFTETDCYGTRERYL